MADQISDEFSLEIRQEYRGQVDHTFVALILGAFSGAASMGVIWVATSVFL